MYDSKNNKKSEEKGSKTTYKSSKYLKVINDKYVF